MKKLVVVLGLTLLAGCASMQVPVSVACSACALLEGTGVCGAVPGVAVSKHQCPQGTVPTIINYREFIEKGATPVVECREKK